MVAIPGPRSKADVKFGVAIQRPPSRFTHVWSMLLVKKSRRTCDGYS